MQHYEEPVSIVTVTSLQTSFFVVFGRIIDEGCITGVLVGFLFCDSAAKTVLEATCPVLSSLSEMWVLEEKMWGDLNNVYKYLVRESKDETILFKKANKHHSSHHTKKCLLMLRLNFMFQFMPVVSYSVTEHHWPLQILLCPNKALKVVVIDSVM